MGEWKMKNKLFDLNNHLFAQLERLGDEELAGDKLAEEINRAKAVSDIATQVISNAGLVLKAKTVMYEYGIGVNTGEDKQLPPLLRDMFLGE